VFKFNEQQHEEEFINAIKTKNKQIFILLNKLDTIPEFNKLLANRNILSLFVSNNNQLKLSLNQKSDNERSLNVIL
jgi:GTP-binding protein EngB required for normal cell division